MTATTRESDLGARARNTARVIGRWCRHRPVTLAITVIVIALTFAGFIAEGWGWQVLDEGVPEVFVQRHWWGTVTSLFAVGDLGALVLIVPLILVVVGEAERLMGSIRTALAYVIGGVAASFAGLAVGLFEETSLEILPLNAPPVDILSPVAALICTAMAASAFAGSLWRRRIRLLSTLTAVTFFLYAGGANDLFSLLAVPIGLGLGYVLGGRRLGFRLVRSSHHEKRVLLAAMTAITAIGPIIATFLGTGAGLLSIYGYLSVDPVTDVDGMACAFGSPSAPCPDSFNSFAELQPASGYIALLPILVALFAAWGILKGRRAALWVAVAVNAITFFSMWYLFWVIQPETIAAIGQLRTTDVEYYIWQTLAGSVVGALVPLFAAITLIVFRRDAHVPTTAKARATFGITVGAAAVVSLALAYVGALLNADGYIPRVGPGDVLIGLPLRLLPPTVLPSDVLTFVPSSPGAQAFWYLPPLLFWAAACVATARLVLDPGAVPGATDRARARAVLERGGGDTLAYMSTWQGNAYWFASESDAAIAYRVRGSIAVTLGGAFGPDHQHPDVYTGFIEFCGDHGWTPVFYSIDDRDSSVFDGLGWQRMQVAEEAILNPQEWNTAGKKRQDIRTATNRAGRSGITARWTSWPELSLAEHAQIRDISEAWVADKSLPEMEFTLGGVDELNDPAVRLMIAVHESGRIEAVTSWLPMFENHEVRGYTLDFMRRRGDAMPGIMEFLIGAAADQMKLDGLVRMSLSGSPLAFTSRDSAAAQAPVARLLDRLGLLLEPAYGFRSLLNFKRKFQPEFVPLWAIYPEATVLPALGVALARAYLPTLTLAGAAQMAGSFREPKATASA
ncbi:phosphatidylglycerol lysyltransferase domain-containing protein [Microbacterium sp. P05]|uniref:phosphatidylglycerol lysyltransferase domain-containing protein n=1 Tax=Microbacterium sp. P05 TaxID=3366948 RepID=UPI0037458723